MATIALNQPAARVRPWVARLVRVGYAAKGIIYLLIGALALQLALGDGGRVTDQRGVLSYITSLPLGTPLLGLIGIGLLAYAFWEITDAFVKPIRGRRGARVALSRALDVVKAAIYGGIGWQALQMALGNGAGRSRGTEGVARDAMQFPLGDVALALVGLGMAAYGVHQVWLAWKGRLDDDMDYQRMRSEGLAWVLTVGRAGIGARGVVLGLIGVALTRAALDRRPAEAGGTAEALLTLLSQPYGVWLLAAISAGLVCYGAWEILHARYARL